MDGTRRERENGEVDATMVRTLSTTVLLLLRFCLFVLFSLNSYISGSLPAAGEGINWANGDAKAALGQAYAFGVPELLRFIASSSMLMALALALDLRLLK